MLDGLYLALSCEFTFSQPRAHVRASCWGRRHAAAGPWRRRARCVAAAPHHEDSGATVVRRRPLEGMRYPCGSAYSTTVHVRDATVGFCCSHAAPGHAATRQVEWCVRRAAAAALHRLLRPGQQRRHTGGSSIVASCRPALSAVNGTSLQQDGLVSRAQQRHGMHGRPRPACRHATLHTPTVKLPLHTGESRQDFSCEWGRLPGKVWVWGGATWSCPQRKLVSPATQGCTL